MKNEVINCVFYSLKLLNRYVPYSPSNSKCGLHPPHSELHGPVSVAINGIKNSWTGPKKHDIVQPYLQ